MLPLRTIGRQTPNTLLSLVRCKYIKNEFNRTKSDKDKPEFKPLFIPGLTTQEQKRQTFFRPQFSDMHEQKVTEVDDWTNVWPCENFFHPSLVPLPIRQGHSKNLVENGGLSPGKYANAELMKIPNFLHLTPFHIQKHCAALKKLTTKWPEGLKTDTDLENHYPVEVVQYSFVNSAPSIRDKRARRVTFKVLLSSLGLNHKSRLKLLRLAKSYGFERGMTQYYSEIDVLELSADRCPISLQNYDYLTYVLSVLTMEAKKRESWENMETGSYLDFEWKSSRQRERLLQLLTSQKSNQEPNLDELPVVKAYRNALEDMFSTPTEELVGPWKTPKKQPKIRHYHWPEIKDIPFEPVVGADKTENLEAYAAAVQQLWSLKPSNDKKSSI